MSIACDVYDRTKPLLEGKVNPEGVELTHVLSSKADVFHRIVRYNEFDVSEMSLSTLVMLASRKECKWKAIPVFPMRFFFPRWSYCNVDAKIERPEDLKGKRVGVPEYQVTAALWNRGILQHEYGVRPEDMEWFEERLEDRIPFQPPKNLSIKKIPPEKNLASMLTEGEISAAIVCFPYHSSVDRSLAGSLTDHPKVKPLFPDAKKMQENYYRKTGIFPINHTIVVKEEILKEHPWVAVNLYNAFVKSKEICYQEWEELARKPAECSLVWVKEALEEQRQVFGRDSFPYGLKANRKTIETVINYSYEQNLSTRKLSLEELFAETTLDL